MDLSASGTDRKQLLVIIGSIAVALGLLYLLFLSGSGSAETPSPFQAPEAAAEAQAPAEDTGPAKATKPKQGPVETFEVFAARDPFQPLVPQGSGSGDSSDPTAPSGTSGAAQSSGKTVNGHRVKLVDVFTKNGKPKAQVQIDSTVYTVDEGEVFADNFELLSVSGSCASMLFGDDQFTLCEGEEILK